MSGPAPGGEVHIRTVNPAADLPAVLELWGGAGPGVRLGASDTPEELAKKLQRDPDLFLVAERRGEIVGAVLGGFDGRRGVIYHLAVRPGLRRTGLGRRLMQEIEDRLQARGCLKAYLLVTRDNPQALEFYAGIGWEPMDLHLLTKVLG
jgi:ribosomal protein S18 acetylase RimI-like enzyme